MSWKWERISAFRVYNNNRDLIAPEAEIAFGAIPYAENQVMRLCADITALQQDTGFQPETSFKDGIRQTIEWYQNEVLGENK